jgi:hypothetical protein
MRRAVEIGRVIILCVIAGLDPVIHHFSQESGPRGWITGASPVMTQKMDRT